MTSAVAITPGMSRSFSHRAYLVTCPGETEMNTKGLIEN